MGDTNSPSNDHYLSEGLVINIFVNNGSADSSLSPLVNLYLKTYKRIITWVKDLFMSHVVKLQLRVLEYLLSLQEVRN